MPPRTRLAPRTAPVLLLALALAGCGGAGGSGGGAPLAPPVPVVVEAPAVPAIEGYVVGGSVRQDASNLSIGDNDLGETLVGFVAFDLTGLGAVTDAILHLEAGNSVGDPFALGDFVLDHVDAGAALDAGDVAGGTLAAAILTFPSAPSWDLDVAEWVRADLLAGRTTSTFRIRLEAATDGDAANDFARIVSSHHVLDALHPRLTVTHVP
ncbi:MAG: hypothetical protein U1E39_15925 [Planctomycetota bacterium]